VRPVAAAFVVASLAGCASPCKEAPTVSVYVRDPSTGHCEETTPPDEVDLACGGDLATPPDFPSCSGACEGLAEADCKLETACHLSYVNGGATFSACWDITPQLTLTGGACETLDADTCAQHTDCATELVLDGTTTKGPASCIAVP
jgi:hypothetical protein